MIHRMPNNGKQIAYLPDIDSLRAVAVFMTMLAHFAPVEIPYLWYGVPIFFTISGFLITTILLNTTINKPSIPTTSIVSNFIIRRALRLFPIYFLFLLFFWFAKKYFNLYLWKDEFTPYFFTYTPNFLIYQIGHGQAGCFSHLWTLGVEEQFYLVWPWLILIVPALYHLPLILGLMAFSIIYRFLDYNNPTVGLLPYTNLHTLGVGALLAHLYVVGDESINWLKSNRHLIFTLTSIILFSVLFFFQNYSRFWYFIREISLCSWTFAIVLVSIFGWKGVVGYFTRNKFVRYLGTISYGIYLFHMPVPFVYRALVNRYPQIELPMSPILFMFFCLSVTIVLAAISYRFIERPFLQLKEKFN